jgi:hypothetical protein
MGKVFACIDMHHALTNPSHSDKQIMIIMFNVLESNLIESNLLLLRQPWGDDDLTDSLPSFHPLSLINHRRGLTFRRIPVP